MTEGTMIATVGVTQITTGTEETLATMLSTRAEAAGVLGMAAATLTEHHHPPSVIAGILHTLSYRVEDTEDLKQTDADQGDHPARHHLQGSHVVAPACEEGPHAEDRVVVALAAATIPAIFSVTMATVNLGTGVNSSMKVQEEGEGADEASVAGAEIGASADPVEDEMSVPQGEAVTARGLAKGIEIEIKEEVAREREIVTTIMETVEETGIETGGAERMRN